MPLPIQQVIELLVCALVDDTGAVSVTAETRETSTVFRVEVAPPDIGKVIGKQGRTARSLRTVLEGCSAKDEHRYALDIVEMR